MALPPSSSPLTKWPQALTDHMEHISSNSCVSWLYSRSLQSVSYLCWESLVLLEFSSAPPPLLPERAGENRMKPRMKRRGELMNDFCFLQLKMLVNALTLIFSEVDWRFLMDDFRFICGAESSGRLVNANKMPMSGCRTANRYHRRRTPALTTWGKMVVSMLAWISLSFKASLWSSVLMAGG